jgi:FkbM family methyltransferase
MPRQLDAAYRARARARAVSVLEAAGLFKAAEFATAPVRLPVGRRNLRRFYSEFVASGDLVFDIGANVGEHSAALLALGARVVSVEPQDACAQRLRRRFGAAVVTVQAAVSSEPGTATLLLNALSNERATLSQEHVEHGRFQRGWEGSENVRVVTVDDLISEHGAPDLCKIDVETHEPEVMRGLSTAIPTIVFEFHEGFPGTSECLGLLDGLGSYEYNFRIGRSSALANDNWTDGNEIERRLHAIAVPVYGDVVARIQRREV